MYDLNHKTIFVLDHTHYFSISSQNYIDLDFAKSKSGNDHVHLPPLSKSLWTCAVESAVEYCRVVWDLFPKGKLIRFIVSDTRAHAINTWDTATQNLNQTIADMSLVGVPLGGVPPSTDCNVIHGMRKALEVLAEVTEKQKDILLAAPNEKIANKGRVICITSARDNASMKSLEDIFNSVLMSQNSTAAASKDLLPIDHCHLVIINVFPLSIESLVTNRPVKNISKYLSSEIHSVAAPNISGKLTHLILSHYDLASTTVTGIPMKEEQNANSSANYDVEILHPRNAHTIICGSEALLPTSMKENAEYETVTLKWCTPRGMGASDMLPCLAQHRVTPVDVTSRPSSCLINFLLNGRAVLLEMPRKPGGKLTSHLLSARGGEIFIHTLHITRTCLEDPPSISEGGGGRVTDYRIGEFAKFVRQNKLVPLKQIAGHSFDHNLLKARSKLFRRSRYFPLTLGSTIIYNLRPYMEVLLETLENQLLENHPERETDIVTCRQMIFNLLGLQNRQEPLPLPNMGHRLKGTKKDEQYKLLWNELELLIRSGDTPMHKMLLQCIQECRIKTESETVPRNIIRATTDSPLSPTHSMESSKNKRSNNMRSLLDIVTATERSQHQKRLDFSGRLCTPVGQIAKLYPDLGTRGGEVKEEDTKSQLKV